MRAVQSSAASASASSFFQQRASSWGPFMVVYGTGQVRATCIPLPRSPQGVSSLIRQSLLLG